ncbi:MAG: helix-turn-helix domain-containing protein [Rhodospirillales bacterium]|nr:helix-turn-helix domain-containing protein [Rhodospirillales bacterium]
MTAQSRFPVLSPADTEVARASCQRLAALLQGDRSLTLNVTGAHGEEAIILPAPVGTLLLEILEGMAAGSPVAVLRKDAELTTQQAANVLNVSRPFLVDLLEQAALPFRKVGTHRRVRIDDVLRYKNEVDAARRRALDELVADAQELDMGY